MYRSTHSHNLQGKSWTVCWTILTQEGENSTSTLTNNYYPRLWQRNNGNVLPTTFKFRKQKPFKVAFFLLPIQSMIARLLRRLSQPSDTHSYYLSSWLHCSLSGCVLPKEDSRKNNDASTESQRTLTPNQVDLSISQYVTVGRRT